MSPKQIGKNSARSVSADLWRPGDNQATSQHPKSRLAHSVGPTCALLEHRLDWPPRRPELARIRATSNARLICASQQMPTRNCLHSSKVCILFWLLQLLLLLLLFRHDLVFGAENSYPRAVDGQSVLVQTRQGFFKGLRRLPADDVAEFLAFHHAPNQIHEAHKLGPICIQRFPIDIPPAKSSRAGLNRAAAPQSNHNPNQTSSWIEWRASLRLLRRVVPLGAYADLRPILRHLLDSQQSEDCLNLNIYAPVEALKSAETKNSSTPVLVVIHGESFDYGAGSAINGSKFARNTRLIVVTFNFRLNILGFPPKLSGASRGNLGLMDQVAALHWIRSNIDSFGGSPDDITLMGTKRGSIFVNMLMMSPLAKGLFKRAIMEDGSALTPLVTTNQMLTPLTRDSLAPKSALSTSVHYMRLLAKLTGCPMANYASPAGAPNGQLQKSTSFAASLGINQNASKQHNFGLGPSSEAVAQADLQTFECLRQKSIDQITTRVPLNVIHFNPINDEILIANHWLKTIVKFESANMTLQVTQAEKTNDFEVIEPDQVGQIVSSVANELLAREMAQTTAASDIKQPHSDAAAAMDNEPLQDDKLANLFESIFTDPAFSLQPLFGPQIESTIFSDEDVVAGMLRPNSTFATRDLMIGLSHSSLAAMNDTKSGKFMRKDHLPFHKITQNIELNGLTSEQAIDWVNVFVKSFYRFHQQEIVNSIIEHYVTSGSRRNSDSFSDYKTSKTKQQINLLNLLVGAFKDALVQVPVLRTAIIHSTRQLDPLVDVFVNQRFDGIRQQLTASNGTSEILINKEQLFEDFIKFCIDLFGRSDWPLELRQANGTLAAIQPRATYLFLMDSEAPADSLIEALDNLKADPRIATSKTRDAMRDLIRATLADDLALQQRMSLDCIFQDDFSVEPDARVEDQLAQLNLEQLCKSIGKTLHSFIRFGRVNIASIDEQLPGEEPAANLQHQLADFDSSCLSKSVGPNWDVHSVQANQEPLHLADCSGQLAQLAALYAADLRSNGLTDANGIYSGFNLFSQQILSYTNDGWQSGALSVVNRNGAESSYNQRGLSGENSFWTNFIAALNCSRTQPAIPAFLLDSPQPGALNSSLLKMNLVFNCYQGTKTAFDYVDALVDAMKSQLEVKLAKLRLIQSHQSNPQSRYTLRMASMNHTDDSESTSNQDHSAPSDLFNKSTVSVAANSSTLTDMMLATSGTGYLWLEQVLKSGPLAAKLPAGIVIVCSLLLLVGFFLTRHRRRHATTPSEDSTASKVALQEASHIETVSGDKLKDQLTAADEANFVETYQSNLEAMHANQSMDPSSSSGLQNEDSSHSMIANEPQPFVSINAEEPLIYWNYDLQNQMFNQVPMCKSHSLLNVKSNVNLAPSEEYFDQVQVDPALLQTTQLNNSLSFHTLDRGDLYQHLKHLKSCNHSNGMSDSSNGHSSATTGRTSISSSSKKRVKIKDPMDVPTTSSDQQMVAMLDLAPNGRSSCPIHRNNTNLVAPSPFRLINGVDLATTNLDNHPNEPYLHTLAHQHQTYQHVAYHRNQTRQE